MVTMSLRRLRRRVLAEFRQDLLREEPHRLALPFSDSGRSSRVRSSAKCQTGRPRRATTVEAITEGSVLYGSPKTFLDRLVALSSVMSGRGFNDPSRPTRESTSRM